jgi:ribonuclease BN (tRNA processing enzyme)
VFISTARAEYQRSDITQVIMLGSGTPNPDPERSGPAIAIVVNDTPYIVDFGPGLIRRAASISPTYGGPIKGLDVKKIKRAFLTHLHSDHSTGFPDLILTPWVMGRDEPLEVYGPKGIVEMTDHLLKAYREDIRYRVYGPESANDQGWRVNAHVVEQGVTYKDANVTVEAFKVRHGAWPNAFGYRFTTPDRVIVISGDAAPDANIEKFSRGANILIHEVYSIAGLDSHAPSWQKYMRENHTSTLELAELASRTTPDLLLLYHVLFMGSSEQDVVAQLMQAYEGEVRLANDMEVY